MLCLILLLNIFSCHSLNPITGLDYIGNGFNYQTGQSGLAPLFYLSYDHKQQWTSPSGTTYDVPDQAFVHDHLMAYEITTQGLYSSYSEFYTMHTESVSFSAGLDIGKIGFGFYYDQQLGFVRDQIRIGHSEFLHGTHWWSFYIMSMYPAYLLKLDPMFQSAIDYLPSSIESPSDKQKVDEFIETFGNFYMHQGVLGAKVDYNSAFSETLAKTYGWDWVTTNYGFSFHYYLFNISAGGFSNQTDIYIDVAFSAASNSNVTFYGGDPALANITSLSAWVATIEKFPTPINMTLNGIWTLISDEKKQQMLEEYILNS